MPQKCRSGKLRTRLRAGVRGQARSSDLTAAVPRPVIGDLADGLRQAEFLHVCENEFRHEALRQRPRRRLRRSQSHRVSL